MRRQILLAIHYLRHIWHNRIHPDKLTVSGCHFCEESWMEFGESEESLKETCSICQLEHKEEYENE
jgi:hypothetical protein